MVEQEKVIERLGKLSLYFKSMLQIGYRGDTDIYKEHRETAKMALDLLKEQNQQIWELLCERDKLKDMLKDQELVKPTKIKSFPMPMYCQFGYECGNCETPLLKDQPYCAGCEKKVKWE